MDVHVEELTSLKKAPIEFELVDALFAVPLVMCMLCRAPVRTNNIARRWGCKLEC